MTSQFSQTSDQFECALRTCCIISKQNASNDLIYREIADPHHWFWLIVNVKGHPIPSPCFIISRWNVSKGLIYFKRGNPHSWFWLTVVESECECHPEFDFIQTWDCWLAYLKDELRRDKTELLAYLKPTIWVKFNIGRNFVRLDILSGWRFFRIGQYLALLGHYLGTTSALLWHY